MNSVVDISVKQLPITIDDLTRNYDKNLRADGIILDFSIAFNTVPTDGIILDFSKAFDTVLGSVVELVIKLII